MKYITLTAIIAPLILCLYCTSLAADALPKEQHANDKDMPVIVCIPIDNPPFAFINNDGELDGFHPELLKLTNIDHPLQINIIDIVSAIALLQDGTCQMLLSNITITQERERLLLFSTPYMHSSVNALVFKESPITTKDDLMYSIIGVRKGGVAEEYAFKHLTGSTLYALRDNDTLVNMLLDGSIEALIDSQSFLQPIAANYDYLHILEPPLFMEEYAYAFASGQAALRDSVNKALIRMKDDGHLKQLYDKWFPNTHSETH